MLGTVNFFLLSVAIASAAPESVVVLVLFDGLREDYVKHMPNIQRVASGGVHVPAVQPVFPSSFLPNVVSIGSGLFAENHGVLDNTEVYDPAANQRVNTSQASFWSQVQKWRTIWVRREVTPCPRPILATFFSSFLLLRRYTLTNQLIPLTFWALTTKRPFS